MKLRKIALIFGFFLVANVACAQKYERVYADATPEVRQHIDENKISGNAMLSGIVAHQTVGLSGLNPAQVASFQAELSADSRVNSINVAADGSSLLLDSQADFAKDELAAVLSHFNATIIAYAATYSLSQE